MTEIRSIKSCTAILLALVAPFVGLAVGGCGDAQGVAASRTGNTRSATAADKQNSGTAVVPGDALESEAVNTDAPTAASSDADVVASAGDESADSTLVAQADQTEPVKPAKFQGVRAISFDDIKFEMEKDAPFVRTMVTEKIDGYDSTKIRIRGFILPSFKQNGLTEFVLVRDNLECCFGPGAALFDCIMVRMQPGKSTSFSVRPVSVEGTFTISEWKDFDGVVRAIYHLDGDEVK